MMINLKEFKQSVLQKAMQGKLTKQLPSDGDAKDLLTKIKLNKQHIINQTHSKRLKKLLQPLPTITAKEIPSNFDIPKNWKWVRFSSLYDMVGGSQPPKATFVDHKKKGYIRLYQTRDYGPKPRPVFIPRNKARKTTIKGNILVARYGGSLGKIFKAHDGAYNVALAKVSPLIHKNELNKNYIWLYLKSNFYLSFVDSLSKSAQSGFNRNDLERLIIPVPPLSEQKRIIVKVHKCFELADTIQKERELNKRFAHDMKQSLLMEAMQGKLTKQLPSDGNAEELLQKIQQKKQALIKAGKIRRHKKLPPISKDEIPFKIPRNWKWVRLGHIGSWKSGSTPRRSNKSYYSGNISWLKTGDLNDGYIISTSEHISENALNNNSLRMNPKGSVLMAMYGATIARLGILKISATTNQACCACIPYLINNKFLFYYLLSQRKSFISLGSGGAQPNISRTKIIHYPIPLPPLAEQKRIVQKLQVIFRNIL